MGGCPSSHRTTVTPGPLAGMYRRERWEVPLAAALLELRECAARLKLTKVASRSRPCPKPWSARRVPCATRPASCRAVANG